MAPERSSDRAPGENLAVLGTVGEFKPLTGTGEYDSMVADNATASKRREAYVALAPLTGVAVPASHANLVQSYSPPIRGGFAQK